MDTTVIIPTTGTNNLKRAVESVLRQTVDTSLLVVIDGLEYEQRAREVLGELQADILILPRNTGGKGYYGHRIYAGTPHFIDTKYISFLDEDCWYEENHIETMQDKLKKDSLDWVYSLRRIMVNGDFYCNDDCESLGKWNPFTQYKFVDSSCYLIPTQNLIQVSNSFHGPCYQDRKFYLHLSSVFKNYDTTGMYTLNYNLENREYFREPLKFFEVGNATSMSKYEKLPWRKH